MRALAMTGIVTASWISRILSASAIRVTPPSRRMSAGTRSSAITAHAPASSAMRAWSAVVTSMITPPLSISARPVLTLSVPTSITRILAADLLREAAVQGCLVLFGRPIGPKHDDVGPADPVAEDRRPAGEALDGDHDLVPVLPVQAEGDDHVRALRPGAQAAAWSGEGDEVDVLLLSADLEAVVAQARRGRLQRVDVADLVLRLAATCEEQRARKEKDQTPAHSGGVR